jgi:hypothetical protein
LQSLNVPTSTITHILNQSEGGSRVTPIYARHDFSEEKTAALEAWGRHLDALDRVGGVAYLEQVALTHPQVFVALLGRVLPLTVKGESAEPVTIQIVKPW